MHDDEVDEKCVREARLGILHVNVASHLKTVFVAKATPSYLEALTHVHTVSIVVTNRRSGTTCCCYRLN